jgi:hypothetical protein
VSHEDYEAIQYESYIPEAIWNHASVKTLIKRLKRQLDGHRSAHPDKVVFGVIFRRPSGPKRTPAQANRLLSS